MDATLTQSQPTVAVTSKKRLRAGQIVSALPVLLLLFDTVIKLMKIAPVVDGFQRLGYPESLARGIGLLELACVVVYVIPRTAVPGAILLTGFLGGAIATHLRIGDPAFNRTLFPLYVGALLWLGLFLRGARLARL